MSNNTSAVQAQIVQAAQAAGVDPTLALGVAAQESNYNQAAVSGAGAIGIFQLMPATAAGLGVDPTDQAQNIQGGIQYLAQMLNQFGGDTSLALAAYNAGPGNVQKYGGIPPFAETQNYVASITSWMQMHASLSGFSEVPATQTAALEPTTGAPTASATIAPTKEV